MPQYNTVMFGCKQQLQGERQKRVQANRRKAELSQQVEQLTFQLAQLTEGVPQDFLPSEHPQVGLLHPVQPPYLANECICAWESLTQHVQHGADVVL